MKKEVSDGSRGGPGKTIVRRLLLNLDVSDLAKIVKAAVEGHVIAFDARHNVIPGQQPERPEWFNELYKRK